MSEYFNWQPKQMSIRPALGKYFSYCVDELYRFEKRATEDLIVKGNYEDGDDISRVTHIKCFVE